MFAFLKKLFGIKPAEVTAEAPYKVEGPAIVSADTVVVPGGDGMSVAVEGAGAVEIPAFPVEAPKAKKPRAKKPAGEKKPRAKKAPKA
jgi:hypothetical protein